MSLYLASTVRQQLQRQSNGVARGYTAASSTPSSDNKNNNNSDNQQLIPTWNDYFKLRSKRRIFEIASYAPSTIFPAAFTGSYFMQMEIDPTTTIVGMDPLMAAGIATVGAVSCVF
jgi:import inner membrane translocase subunit TIM23